MKSANKVFTNPYDFVEYVLNVTHDKGLSTMYEEERKDDPNPDGHLEALSDELIGLLPVVFPVIASAFPYAENYETTCQCFGDGIVIQLPNEEDISILFPFDIAKINEEIKEHLG